MDNSSSPYPPPYPPPPPPPADASLRPGAVVRDVAIFWGLTTVGGFIVGFVSAALHLTGGVPVLAIALCNLGLGLVAFTLSGSLVPPSIRWKHLAVVALAAWLTSLVNVAFFHATLLNWAFGAIFIGLLMGLGGALSYVFNPDRRPSA